MSSKISAALSPDQLSDIICNAILSDFVQFTLLVKGSPVDFEKYSEYSLAVWRHELENKYSSYRAHIILNCIISNLFHTIFVDTVESSYCSALSDVYAKFQSFLSHQSEIEDFVASFRCDILHRNSSSCGLDDEFTLCFSTVASWLQFYPRNLRSVDVEF